MCVENVRDGGNTTSSGGTVTERQPERDDERSVGSGALDFEDALRLKSEAVDMMVNGFDIVDERGLFVYANPAYLQMWGYASLEEVLGTSPSSHCADPGMPAQIMEVLARDGHGDFEFLARRKDGSTFEVHMRCRLFKDSQGRQFFTGVSTDMTERNQLLRQYRQAQKMEAIGRLVGGVVHDFNNLLQVIIGCSHLALDSLDEPDTVKEELDQIVAAGDSAAGLVKQLLMTSKRQPVRAEKLDLAQVVSETLAMLARLLGEQIRIEWEPPAGLSPVEVDRALFEQILVNLAINARDAMGGPGGLLRVEADEVQLEVPANGRGDKYCRLVVADDGCGMEEAVLERVFEPFFTTKPEGQGSGLGLATVYGIVRGHGGHLNVKSEPGVGSAFEILLPAASGKSQARPAEVRTPVHNPESGLTILVADDNTQIRGILVRILRKAGFRTLEADDGKKAVELFKRHRQRVALVLLDILMPHMGGGEALARMRELDPGLPVLFSSGYNDARLSKVDALVRSSPMLHKPYSGAELVAAVRQQLTAATRL